MRNSLLLMALVVAITSVAGQASGQDQRAVAEALFTAGRTAAQKGDYVTACQMLEESYRLDPATGTLLNVADCSEHIGKLATAWLSYSEAVRSLESDDRRVAFAQKKVSEIERRVPRLTIRLALGSPPDTTVRIRGVAIGRGGEGVALPVDPGTFRVDVESPGREARTLTLQLAEGEVRELEVTVGPPVIVAQESPRSLEAAPGTQAVAPRSPADSPSGLSRSKWSLQRWSAAGIGVAGLAVGVATGAMAITARGKLDERCEGTRCPPSVETDVGRYNTLRALSTAGFITLGVGAAGLVTLLLVDGRASDHGTRVGVSSGIGPSGVSISGTF